MAQVALAAYRRERAASVLQSASLQARSGRGAACEVFGCALHRGRCAKGRCEHRCEHAVRDFGRRSQTLGEQCTLAAAAA
eukprot:13666857-Alexandrium_andersonii.AAC.1